MVPSSLNSMTACDFADCGGLRQRVLHLCILESAEHRGSVKVQ